MKAILLTIFSACILLSACSDSTEPDLAPETIFQEEGLQVITSIFNKKAGTIATLYGNEQAKRSAGAGENENHIPDEIFKLVTWKLKANPYWFGGNINGPVQAVESLNVVNTETGAIRVVYKVEKDIAGVLQKDQAARQERINFIFDQTASVFPQR